jgi:hypothetical protein
MELLLDKNPEIRKMASQALDIVAVRNLTLSPTHQIEVVQEYDKDVAKKIKEKKFTAHNTEWCDITHAEDAAGNYSPEEEEYEEDEGGNLNDTMNATSGPSWKNIHGFGEDI